MHAILVQVTPAIVVGLFHLVFLVLQTILVV